MLSSAVSGLAHAKSRLRFGIFPGIARATHLVDTVGRASFAAVCRLDVLGNLLAQLRSFGEPASERGDERVISARPGAACAGSGKGGLVVNQKRTLAWRPA